MRHHMTDRKRTTKTGGDPPNRNRWKSLLATRQPDAVIKAFQRIAKKRNTTVSAMLGEAAVKIVANAREELPQKLQGQLRNLSADRPPLGRPRAKRSAAKPDRLTQGTEHARFTSGLASSKRCPKPVRTIFSPGACGHRRRPPILSTASGSLDLPRFRGGVRAWDHAI